MLRRAKKLVLALCVVAVSNYSFGEPVLIKSEQDIYEYQLDNGFRVVLAPNQKENKVFINTIYFTGSLNDPQGKGGLAHLLEHLAFKGTENIKQEEFQRRLDQYTLSNNASTSYYTTQYTNIVRPDKNALAEMMLLEAERMDKLVLQEKFVPSEIEIVRREREIRLDQPFAVMMDQIWKAAYGNQSLGRLPIGDLEELKSIQMPELQTFYRQYYAPNNAVMVVAGKFDIQEILKDIDQNFSGIQSRALPAPVKVPVLQPEQIKQRDFVVRKGSDLAKFHIYINAQDQAIQPALSIIPYLYTMEPSGYLYQNMVQNGISTGVMSTTWLDQNFNLVFLGAVYAPTQDAKAVEKTLTQKVENTTPFSATDLNRIKNIAKNSQKNMMSSSVAVGTALSSYLANQQTWQQFFKDQQAVQDLNIEQVNQVLKNFLVSKHRMNGDIQPTPEDQKQAQQQLTEQNKTLDQQEAQAQPLKDPKVYEQEVINFVKQSAQLLGKSEQKIQRGQFSNGMKYALFPTSTRDDRVYATINLNFGNEKSLFNQSEIIDLSAYLILRGSDKQTFQDITDKSIALDGSASVNSSLNSMQINISAPKENFEQYFDYIIDVLKHPRFDQKEFDLIKAQSLQSLDRPYTEPEVVAGLTLSRLIERYPAGDLRYHFEPEFAKKQLEQATNQQVKDFYQKYFAMNHAQVAVTGAFNAKQMQRLLKKSFAYWNSKQPYAPVLDQYQSYAAQAQHVLAEQREFGNYQSVLTVPVGVYHQDAPALIVFSHILGNSQLSSRLAKALREKNALVYGFASRLNLDDETNAGALTISANYTSGRASQVTQTVHQVLQDLLQHGVTEQELEAAKANIMKQRATMLEDDRNIHRILTNQLEQDKTMASRAQRDLAIAKLTVADVNDVIKKYIKPNHFVEVMADQYGEQIK
ncbi:M16 family metallopeptidase [Acinetobacter populi]|uniref:Peptidase M16 n=1 Tax=Acinetobacter populi TaxID=1582270 RepID=A0A1Z9YYC2_9GAMM|nr:pitrilysin family protein [Acinetobacter populi]OUY07162.1 peptidase M16 [Acinetobacter populi]